MIVFPNFSAKGYRKTMYNGYINSRGPASIFSVTEISCYRAVILDDYCWVQVETE